MTSYEIRNNPLFLRNAYFSDNIWDIPCIEKQDLSLQHALQPRKRSLYSSSTKYGRSEKNVFGPDGKPVTKMAELGRIPRKSHRPTADTGLCVLAARQAVHHYRRWRRQSYPDLPGVGNRGCQQKPAAAAHGARMAGQILQRPTN